MCGPLPGYLLTIIERAERFHCLCEAEFKFQADAAKPSEVACLKPSKNRISAA